MIIKVKVIPNAKKSEIVVLGQNSFKVKLTSVPEKGKANKELVELLAEYFGTKKLNVRIIHGEFHREKVIEIKQ